MKTHLKVFVYNQLENLIGLFLIAKFAYNNTKNTSISYTPFKLNYGYYLRISYKKDVNLQLKLKATNKFFAEVKILLSVYKKNPYHTQKLQDLAHDKIVKVKNYTSGNKIYFNRKYIKT